MRHWITFQLFGVYFSASVFVQLSRMYPFGRAHCTEWMQTSCIRIALLNSAKYFDRRGPSLYFHGKLYPDHPASCYQHDRDASAGKTSCFRDYVLSESIDNKTFEDTSGQGRSFGQPAHWRGATKLSSGSPYSCHSWVFYDLNSLRKTCNSYQDASHICETAVHGYGAPSYGLRPSFTHAWSDTLQEHV